MGKGLLQFAQFVVGLLLLLIAGSFIHAGQPGGAIAIFVAMAGYSVWQLTRSRPYHPSLEDGPGSDRRKIKPHILDLSFIGFWLAALILVTGVFGQQREIFNAFVVIGIAIGMVRFISDRKNSD